MTERSLPASPAEPPQAMSGEARAHLQAMATCLAVNVVSASLMVWLFRLPAASGFLLPWSLTFGCVVALRLWMVLRYRRLAGPAPQRAESLRRLWNVLTVLAAALWGLAFWVLFSVDQTHRADALILIGYSICLSALPVLATQPRVYVTYVSLCFFPLLLRVATSPNPGDAELALVLGFALALTVVFARNYRRLLLRQFEFVRDSEQLLEQLRLEKASAESARLAAEAANRAKTQFLAAASHDLRQPMHAMGLFAGALRQRPLDLESEGLVRSINESVDALEGLFSQLLDHSRLESGVIEVQSQEFSLAETYRKLRLRFEPLAFEKGLALRFRGGHHRAWGDPLLVDRIMQNLVSNAIRYTTDGTVLVGCRRRDDHLLMQVWDTGPGIAEQEQSRIFDEMYQVPDVPRPDNLAHQGQGLGLSIVRRLAGLMHAPITLQSQLGVGSVFTLQMPAAHPAALLPLAPPTVPTAQPVLHLTLEDRLILIVEDDEAVRRGLEALLLGWGARVLSMPDAKAFDQWIAMGPPERKPDLLVLDYWLDSQRNGLQVLTEARALLGENTPAILLSGSALSAADIEAQHPKLHLLVKPVAPVKLRALIGFKLGDRSH
jgi:signal transduction histidine kinase